MLLLLWITAIWTRTKNDVVDPVRRLHRSYGRDRLPLALVTEEAEQWSDEPLEDYFEWLIENYVLSQSTRVALEKMARGQVHFFIARAVYSEDLELTRFRGHSISWEREVHDAENERAVSAGVSAADGGAGPGWSEPGGALIQPAPPFTI